MPYYVYAIHTNSNYNRLYGAFDDFHEVDVCERNMQKGRIPGDNYIVRMVYAENESQSLERINQIRRETGLPI
jgi:hypothetical protein